MPRHPRFRLPVALLPAPHMCCRSTPDLVNKSPYEKGWMVKIKLADAAQANSLLDSAAYGKVAAAEEH